MGVGGRGMGDGGWELLIVNWRGSKSKRKSKIKNAQCSINN